MRRDPSVRHDAVRRDPSVQARRKLTVRRVQEAALSHAQDRFIVSCSTPTPGMTHGWCKVDWCMGLIGVANHRPSALSSFETSRSTALRNAGLLPSPPLSTRPSHCSTKQARLGHDPAQRCAQLEGCVALARSRGLLCSQFCLTVNVHGKLKGRTQHKVASVVVSSRTVCQASSSSEPR